MNIWVPKFKILEPKSEIKVSCGFCGEYQLHARRPNGTIRASTPWFSNLITDAGRDFMSSSPTSNKVNWCAVGTGTVPPEGSQTSLQTLVATTTTSQGISSTKNISVLPYSISIAFTYRFALNAVIGDMTEVGVGWSSTGQVANFTLFSRELIRDINGDPVAFTVLSGEQLDVVYRITQYIPDQDFTGTVDITGSGTHDYIARAEDIDGSAWLFSLATLHGTGPRTASSSGAFSGNIGTIFTSPTGSSSGGGGMFITGAYIPGSYYRDVASDYGLTQGNFAGGIRSARWNLSGVNGNNRFFQYQYTPTIDKTATKTLRLIVRISHEYLAGPLP